MPSPLFSVSPFPKNTRGEEREKKRCQRRRERRQKKGREEGKRNDTPLFLGSRERALLPVGASGAAAGVSSVGPTRREVRNLGAGDWSPDLPAEPNRARCFGRLESMDASGCNVHLGGLGLGVLHNALCDVWLKFFKLADVSAQEEAPSLLPGTAARPADMFFPILRATGRRFRNSGLPRLRYHPPPVA